MKHGHTIVRIIKAIERSGLAEPFSPRQVDDALGIKFAGTFLPKHRLGNPGGNTPLFIRLSSRPALYKLNHDYIRLLEL